MKKLNQKGFAIAGMLYSLFVVFLMVLLSVLAGLYAKKIMSERSVVGLENSFLGDDSKKDSLIQKVIQNKVAPVRGKYVFHINNTLLWGLEDVSNVNAPEFNGSSNSKMIYSIQGNDIIVTATENDGWGMTTGRAYLQAGQKYIFSFEIKGEDGANANTGTFDASFCLDGGSKCYNSREIEPDETGTYFLRLGVNVKGKSYTFSNISLTGGNGTDCVAYLNRDDIIGHSVVFIPDACNQYDYVYSFEDGATGNVMTLTNIYSFEGETE